MVGSILAGYLEWTYSKSHEAVPVAVFWPIVLVCLLLGYGAYLMYSYAHWLLAPFKFGMSIGRDLGK